MKIIKLALIVTLFFALAGASFGDYLNIHRQAKRYGLELKDFNWDVTYSYVYEKVYATEAITRTNELDLAGSYSFNKNFNLSLDLPINYIINPDSSLSSGIGDLSLFAAWNFWKNDIYNFAFLPTVTFPTGNYQAGIGNGRSTYCVNLTLTRDKDPLALHWSLLYKRNDNLTNNRVDIWKFYFSPVAKLSPEAKLMFNLGVESNTSLTSKQSPIYASGGLIRQINKALAFTPTLKLGFNKPETDVTVYLDFSW